VAQLVSEDEPQLVVVQHVDHAAVDHHEWPVEAQGHRPRLRVRVHVEQRQVADVERGRSLRVELVDARELAVVDAHRRAQVHQSQSPLVPQPGQLAQHIVESPELAQRRQRPPVGRVLPRLGADVGEFHPRPDRAIVPAAIGHGATP
jgi:hypothetical protein